MFKVINKNKYLAVFIYSSKNSFLDFEIHEFKKLIISSNILINKFIKCYIKSPNNKYYFGIGKLNELKLLIEKNKYNYILLNYSIRIVQERNLIRFLNCKIIDRTKIILNIFKQSAKTYFGKLQIKLAYLNYLSTRLVNRWKHLERQKGGIKNISGPGEKQLEIDKRIIKNKIFLINKKLCKINLQKKKSEKLRTNCFTISLVGYTNSGKSTLFNLLTKSNNDIKNMLFTTLDVYIRKIKFLNKIKNILITDTIGLIQNLPLNIFNAFKFTFNEINNSKLIFHIIDISDSYFKYYINYVNSILNKVLYKFIPIVQIMNKIDKIDKCKYNMDNVNKKIWISAKYNIGIEYIYKYIINFFSKDKFYYKLSLNNKLSLILRNYLYKNNLVIKEWSLDSEKYNFLLFLNKIDLSRLLKFYPFIKIYLKKND